MYCHYKLQITQTINRCFALILAQLEYQHRICTWEAKGVPFRRDAYVPEQHPITGTDFHGREDEAHVLKVVVVGIVYSVFIVH